MKLRIFMPACLFISALTTASPASAGFVVCLYNVIDPQVPYHWRTVTTFTDGHKTEGKWTVEKPSVKGDIDKFYLINENKSVTEARWHEIRQRVVFQIRYDASLKKGMQEKVVTLESTTAPEGVGRCLDNPHYRRYHFRDVGRRIELRDGEG